MIRCYEEASGQFINLDKSSITFIPSSSIDMKEIAFSILNINHNVLCEAYLGLLAFTGRNKRIIFEGVKQRVWRKLQCWKSKLFSAGGREVLIKTVAQDIPTYTMSLFRLPISLCHQIQSMIINFWWGAKRDEKKVHWSKWRRLCSPKSQGGMGFRDFEAFNQALLAKQKWRILNYSQSLAAHIYKSRYYPRGSFLDASFGNNSSYVRHSLIYGRKLLLKE